MGKFGYHFKPDKLIREVNPNNYNGVIIPGGTTNPDHLRREPAVLKCVKELNDKN
jgi:protease I